jgi:hypothetical protein
MVSMISLCPVKINQTNHIQISCLLRTILYISYQAHLRAMIESYKNTIGAALFVVVGLIGYIFSGSASVPEAAAQSSKEMMQDMMNMTGMGLDASLPYKSGVLETPDIPIKCVIVGDLIKSALGNVTTVDQFVAAASNFIDTTGDTNANGTRQMVMDMLKEQVQNMTDQDLQEMMDFVECSPVMGENTTQNMMGGSSMID